MYDDICLLSLLKADVWSWKRESYQSRRWISKSDDSHQLRIQVAEKEREQGLNLMVAFCICQNVYRTEDFSSNVSITHGKALLEKDF